MLTKNIKVAMIAGKAVVLSALLSTTAFAQDTATQETTEVEQPGEESAVVPAEVMEADSPVGTAVESDYPSFDPEQMANDQAIAETLLEQGFSDVKILREGSLMTVTAMRDAEDIELVYNLVEGRLIKVNGERILSAEEQETTGAGTTAVDVPEDLEDGTTDDGATDDGTTDDGSTDDGTTDDGSTDGSTGDGTTDDGSTDDGSTDDGSTDGSTDDGSTDDGSTDDSGSDPDSGSDTGSDSDGTEG